MLGSPWSVAIAHEQYPTATDRVTSSITWPLDFSHAVYCRFFGRGILDAPLWSVVFWDHPSWPLTDDIILKLTHAVAYKSATLLSKHEALFINVCWPQPRSLQSDALGSRPIRNYGIGLVGKPTEVFRLIAVRHMTKGRLASLRGYNKGDSYEHWSPQPVTRFVLDTSRSTSYCVEICSSYLR